MYKSRFASSSRPSTRSKRPSGHGFASSSGTRYATHKSSGNQDFRHRRFQGRSRRSKGIDVSKFINKAVEIIESEDYTAKHRFEDFDLKPALKRNIQLKGYITPTPIQDQSIPHIIEGKDVIGIADTGTGKTASFLIPLINKIMGKPYEKVLIVVPTRELALQINAEFISFAKGLGIFSTVCIGGTSMSNQFRALKMKYHFIIGTPGRLKDLANRRLLNLNQCSNVVLDEVDRMLDMGFVKDVRFLLEQLPEKKQSMFFSATLNREVSALINNFTIDPVSISLKTRDTASTVEQDIIRIEDRTRKEDILHDLLIKSEFKKVLIFARTKWGVRKLSINLNERGFKTDAIHGDKSQAQRQRALEKFKRDHVNILVATDVAARGLDIADVSHVINYDTPENYEDYVHRIGRTGRAHKKGFALTFVE